MKYIEVCGVVGNVLVVYTDVHVVMFLLICNGSSICEYKYHHQIVKYPSKLCHKLA